MKFERTPRVEAFNDTSQKRAALRRKQRLEREALPLLAQITAEQQPTEDQVMEERAARWIEADQQRRDEKAAHWRRLRARLFSNYGENLRAALREAWRKAPYPATWAYFGDMLTSFDRGHLVFTEDGRLVSPAHLEWINQGGAAEARRRIAAAQERMRKERAA